MKYLLIVFIFVFASCEKEDIESGVKEPNILYTSKHGGVLYASKHENPKTKRNIILRVNNKQVAYLEDNGVYIHADVMKGQTYRYTTMITADQRDVYFVANK